MGFTIYPVRKVVLVQGESRCLDYGEMTVEYAILRGFASYNTGISRTSF